MSWPTSVGALGGKWPGDPRVMGSAADYPRSFVIVENGSTPAPKGFNGSTATTGQQAPRAGGPNARSHLSALSTALATCLI